MNDNLVEETRRNNANVASIRDEMVREEIMRIGSQVSELHEVVMNLVKGIAAAQQAGGMAGMMARQLPDMTGAISVGQPGVNGV